MSEAHHQRDTCMRVRDVIGKRENNLRPLPCWLLRRQCTRSRGRWSVMHDIHLHPVSEQSAVSGHATQLCLLCTLLPPTVRLVRTRRCRAAVGRRFAAAGPSGAAGTIGKQRKAGGVGPGSLWADGSHAAALMSSDPGAKALTEQV